MNQTLTDYETEREQREINYIEGSINVGTLKQRRQALAGLAGQDDPLLRTSHGRKRLSDFTGDEINHIYFATLRHLQRKLRNSEF